jgi:hypothetical protein
MTLKTILQKDKFVGKFIKGDEIEIRKTRNRRMYYMPALPFLPLYAATQDPFNIRLPTRNAHDDIT